MPSPAQPSSPSSPSSRLLICGFGPFPGAPDNPSARIVERLEAQAWAPPGWTAAYAAIPTTWAGAFEAVVAALRSSPVEAVLVIGVAPGATALRVETQARRHGGETRPDAAGATCASAAIPANGPAIAAADLPADAMVAAIAAQGLPAEVSTDAGDYLCNHVFYRLLTEARSIRAAFLHIPPVGEDGAAPSLDDLERGAKAAAAAFAQALHPARAQDPAGARPLTLETTTCR